MTTQLATPPEILTEKFCLTGYPKTITVSKDSYTQHSFTHQWQKSNFHVALKKILSRMCG